MAARRRRRGLSVGAERRGPSPSTPATGLGAGREVGRAKALDRLGKAWNGTIGNIRHHREHVVFEVIVGIPREEGQDRVQQHGAGIEPMVANVVGQAGVLGDRIEDDDPGAKYAREEDEQDRQPALGGDRNHGHRGVTAEKPARVAHYLRVLALRHEMPGHLRPAAEGGLDHAAHVDADVPQTQELAGQPRQIGGPWHLDFGIGAGGLGVGVVEAVRPTVEDRLPDRQEAGGPIDGLVEPSIAEWGAVATLVRDELGEHEQRRVEKKGGNRPVGSPGQGGDGPARRHGRHVAAEIDQSLAVPAARQRFEFVAIDLAAVPFRRGVLELHRRPPGSRARR